MACAMNHFDMGAYMWIFWLVVLLVVLFIIRLVIKGGTGQQDTRLETPLEILKKRYARGEIDKEEYESMKNDLGE